MKLILISCLTLLLFASCQKKQSCKCTTTISAQYYRPYTTETVEQLPKNITKKKAKQICDNTAVQVGANAKMIIGDSWSVGTECVVKDY